MRRKILLSLLTGICLFSYSNSQTVNQSQSWINSLSSVEALQEAYLPKAVHINEQGEVLNGSESISNFWIKQDLENISSNVVFETAAIYKNDIVYKIESFTSSEQNEYTHLLIEQATDSENLRKLEFISKKEGADIDLSIIDQRRDEWIEYCNAHDAEALVENLYTENAVYYNHRPVIIGREALTQTYQYMNSPRYSLNLTPLHVEVVNESIVFEIGQCDGSYNGKYILVWQKVGDTWSILMDSNI